MRAQLLFLTLFAGCGPTTAELFSGENAISLAGDGCINASGATAAIGEVLTVEAWIRIPEDSISERTALVTLGRAAMLWVDEDRVGFSEPAETPMSGYQTTEQLFDGEPHHVAATWTPDGGDIFVDGVRSGTGQAWSILPGIDNVSIGCYEDGNRYLDGVIDEVRVSTATRYAGNFEVEKVPFEVDEGTVSLWHFNDGTGELALDQTDRFPATLVNGAWTSGLVTPAVAAP